MRTCYFDAEHNAIADLVCPGELTAFWTITRINVPQKYRGQKQRGRGVGTKLLRRILADADAEGVELALEVSPSDGLDYVQLTAWYRRHGFRSTSFGYLVRRPTEQTEKGQQQT
jgi:ribosomal protein S18 acetylase RimI-like enzyme